MKLKITQIGTPKTVNTKYGPKEKSYIKAQEYGDVYLSYWLSPLTKDWKEGDEIDVVEVTTREWEGKTYHDIVLPKANHADNTEVMNALREINNRTLKTHLLVEELVNEKRSRENPAGKIMGTDIDYPTAESEGLTDVPF